MPNTIRDVLKLAQRDRTSVTLDCLNGHFAQGTVENIAEGFVKLRRSPSLSVVVPITAIVAVTYEDVA